MLLMEIQQNITKAKYSLNCFEQDFIYKAYKTVGGSGDFEQELRKIFNQLIDLQNSVISRTESIIRFSENKELLSLIDQNFYRNFAESISDESSFRALHLPDFNMPQTSLNVISENKNVISEMQAINKNVQGYNTLITNFRQKRNKYYITLYKVPNNNDLPDILIGSVNLEGLLPNAQVMSNYIRNKQTVQALPKKIIEKIKIIKKGGYKNSKIRIIKNKEAQP